MEVYVKRCILVPITEQFFSLSVAVRVVKLLTFCFQCFPSLLSVGVCICLSVCVWSWPELAGVPGPSPFYSPAVDLVIKLLTPFQDKSQTLSSTHCQVVYLPHVAYCLGRTFWNLTCLSCCLALLNDLFSLCRSQDSHISSVSTSCWIKSLLSSSSVCPASQ